MIKVYHYKGLNKDERDRLNASSDWDSEPRFSRYINITAGHASNELVLGAWLIGEYEDVAVVDTNNLETAWERTNHIHERWEDNEGLVAAKRENRSSSVGDIFERDGKLYVVASFGFEVLPTVTPAC